jgi:hypothetical protein
MLCNLYLINPTAASDRGPRTNSSLRAAKNASSGAPIKIRTVIFWGGVPPAAPQTLVLEYY